MRVSWPNGYKFAFTVVDDTDCATVENVKPVYDLLAGLGMRTTKTVWIFRPTGPQVGSGATCEDKDYLDWVLALQRDGFEIGFHNAAPCTSGRETTALALNRFHDTFGADDILFCNHMACRENMYWGEARLSGWRRAFYRVATLTRRRAAFHGHVNGQALFWGDLCRQHVRYVRNFVFDELDALAVCPEQPYHDSSKPYVNFWFTSADGSTLELFLKNFTPEKLQALEAAGGLCIAYVHFAYGFVENGRVNRQFQERLEFLASRNGWFAPASSILEHLRQGATPDQRSITPSRLGTLERKWLFQKVRKGTT